jgi:hypothetical protein
MSHTQSFMDGEKKKLVRFRRLDNQHISAIESLYIQYPILRDRFEIHMPFHRAKPTFSSESVWVWPKFDKRPVGFLIFMEGFAPCIWFPDRQEGLTFRWLLSPTFCQNGPTICLANILADESLLQIEDIIVHHGKDLWSQYRFSERWNKLKEFWSSLPPHQPLLAFKPQIVKPLSIEEWSQQYDSSIYWIIQHDQSKQPRWFWKDIVTVPSTPLIPYVPPKLKRNADIPITLCASCSPYTKMILPDTYSLSSQEGTSLGIASISTIELSQTLQKFFNDKNNTFVPVEVKWNESFKKYQIISILPTHTTISTTSFFHHIST